MKWIQQATERTPDESNAMFVRKIIASDNTYSGKVN